MYILIDLEDNDAELEDPADTKRLHVAVAHGDDLDAVRGVLEAHDVGKLVVNADDDDDEGHVWVSVAWIRREAEGRVHARWGEDFDHLLTHAAKKGWLDDAGTHLRAHIEWVADEF